MIKGIEKYLRKTIRDVSLNDNKLKISFDDGTKMVLFDDGQSCCERRYMVCDDDLDYYAGATLLNIKIGDTSKVKDEEFSVHQVQFLRVTTDKGTIVCSNHNEHNGYYGGFSIRIEG